MLRVPELRAARSSAEVSIDFFGGVSTNSYGYSSSAGVVRMRQSWVSLDWYKTTAQAGYTMPLISPLSPTSYATVAQPGLAGSGNLWTWSPQLQVEQRIPLTEQSRIGLEGGLIIPPASGYTSTQLDSPVEASRHPGYEGRFSYRADGSRKGIPRPVCARRRRLFCKPVLLEHHPGPFLGGDRRIGKFRFSNGLSSPAKPIAAERWEDLVVERTKTYLPAPIRPPA